MSDSALSVCERLGITPSPPLPGSKLGLALSTLGNLPINALRHSPSEGTSGWYIWCGESLLETVDFFSPLHIEHVYNYVSQIEGYLDLPPGYRILLGDSGFEDVWYDATLLDA